VRLKRDLDAKLRGGKTVLMLKMQTKFAGLRRLLLPLIGSVISLLTPNGQNRFS
jgi:hypothetical protein